MNAVDTNVLIYRLDRRDPVKWAKARDLVRKLRSEPLTTTLLWQVLAEFVCQLRRWETQRLLARAKLLRHVKSIRQAFALSMPTPDILDTALDLAGRHSLSHWYSMILGACKEAGITTLYTEDMGAPTVYDGIQLINPFV